MAVLGNHSRHQSSSAAEDKRVNQPVYAEPEAGPLYSILLPSYNRLELAIRAIESVTRQNYSDVEIVVSDNGSSDDYSSLLRKFSSAQITLIRSEQTVSVTENWNRSLNAARGRYFIMLGDDDALAPGFFDNADRLLARYDDVDVIYWPAYHYAYPSVAAHAPDGYLFRVDNSVLFRDHLPHYILEAPKARHLGMRCLSFHHDISFNAQHFLVSTIWARANISDCFYKSPYPDYFSCFTIFLKGPRLLVDTRPAVIIGISPRSYGFYHLNNRADEGATQFHTDPLPQDFEKSLPQEVRSALALPGSAHTRSWLLAACWAAAEVGAPFSDIDLRRYRRIQAVDTATAVAERKLPIQALNEISATYPAREARLAQRVYDALAGFRRPKRVEFAAAAARLRTGLKVYLEPVTETYDLGGHSDILDAVDHLEGKFTRSERLKIHFEQLQSLLDAAKAQAVTEADKYKDLARSVLALERELDEGRQRAAVETGHLGQNISNLEQALNQGREEANANAAAAAEAMREASLRATQAQAALAESADKLAKTAVHLQETRALVADQDNLLEQIRFENTKLSAQIESLRAVLETEQASLAYRLMKPFRRRGPLVPL